MRLLDQSDDLDLVGCGISHASSPPSPIMLFLSSRFSREVGDHLLQGLRLAAKILHLVGRRGARRVAGEPPFTRVKELLRPAIVHR